MNDEIYQEILEKLKEGNEYKNYVLKNGQIYKRKDGTRKVLRRFEMEAVLQIMHDHPVSAHMAVKATYEKIKERFYWPGMKKNIEDYVKSCDSCQRRNKPRGKHE